MLVYWNIGKKHAKNKSQSSFHYSIIPLFQFVRAGTVATESRTMEEDGGRNHDQSKKSQ
jgi:hypothetical protein